jgi:bis(5'-nucleosyl)-tetraphosphatase (symmetrical)
VATYAVGDVQGCYAELCQLLDKVAFASTDTLWLAGDLVNRGPDSLAVLRMVRSLGTRAVCVLGNHDLHLLAIYYGGHKTHRGDTFDALLNAPDMPEIAQWYLQQPLLVVDPKLGFAMAHAGIPPIWTLSQAQSLAQEVQDYLQHDDYAHYFRELYGNEPNRWHDDLVGMDRLRLITNYFTRMRLIRPDGQLEFKHKGVLLDLPKGYKPWFDYASLGIATPELVSKLNKRSMQMVFGHWAALEGLTNNPTVTALDTGCVWGRTLTALNLDTGQLSSVSASVD